MHQPSLARSPRKIACATALLTIAAALAVGGAPASLPATAAPQLSVVRMEMGLATGRVVFCVTKDTMLIAAVEGGAGGAQSAGNMPARLPAIVSLGGGRVAVLLGAVDWMSNQSSEPTHLDEEIPAIARKGYNSTVTPNAQDQTASDIEGIGVTFLEFIRPFVDDVHYQLNLGPDEPVVELLLAGYTEGYGPEVWDLRYQVRQRNLGNDYWETRLQRPAYYQLYPPEKGDPKTFLEVRYPAAVAPLELARAAQSDPAVGRIRSASKDTEEAVAAILRGESDKADTRPTEEFLRLAIPAVAGADAKLAVAAVDQRYKFAWVLESENAPAAEPEETSAQPGTLRQQEQTERPSLRRAGPPTAQ